MVFITYTIEKYFILNTTTYVKLYGESKLNLQIRKQVLNLLSDKIMIVVKKIFFLDNKYNNFIYFIFI